MSEALSLHVTALTRLELLHMEKRSRLIRYEIAWDGQPEKVRELFKYERRLRKAEVLQFRTGR